jgi:hypothetical protein
MVRVERGTASGLPGGREAIAPRGGPLRTRRREVAGIAGTSTPSVATSRRRTWLWVLRIGVSRKRKPENAEGRGLSPPAFGFCFVIPVAAGIHFDVAIDGASILRIQAQVAG